MKLLMGFFLFLDIFCLALAVLGTFWAFLRECREKNQTSSLTGITILKPVKGLEVGLEENLESFFKIQSSIPWELIFSIADGSDPSRPILEKILKKHHDSLNSKDARGPRRALLLLGAPEVGLNPKVNNLIRGYELAQFDQILISDSNVRVLPDYLDQMSQALGEGVGMVGSVIAGDGVISWGGALEAMSLNTFYARGMYIAECFGKSCIIGKSMLFKRSQAERFGGLRLLSQYLAEDFMAGEGMRYLGLQTKLSLQPIYQVIGKHSFRSFWERHVRWGRIRRAQVPIVYFFEPLIHSFLLPGIFGACSLWYFFEFSFGLVLLCHLVFWFLLDLCLISTLTSHQVGIQSSFFYQKILFIPAWIFKEVVSFPIWVCTVFGSSVLWRGQKLALGKGGILKHHKRSPSKMAETFSCFSQRSRGG